MQAMTVLVKLQIRGGSRISGKGFICVNVWGLALLILSNFFFVNIPCKRNNLVSLGGGGAGRGFK